MSCWSSSTRSRTPTTRASMKRRSPWPNSSMPPAASSGSPPESCQAYSACSAIWRACLLAVFMQLHSQLRHFDGDAPRFGALVEPRLGLRFVLGREDAVGNRHARFQRDFHDAARRFVGDDL